MDVNNFYIKRIEFVKTIPKKYDNLNNFWVVCFETGDYINKVSDYFTKIETFNDLKTLNYELRHLLDEHMTFYTKITKYININPNNIKMIDDLILNDNTDIINNVDNSESFNWNGPVSYDNVDDDSLITHDFGLFYKNEDKYYFVKNAIKEIEKHLFNQIRNLDKLIWTIKNKKQEEEVIVNIDNFFSDY